MANGDGESVRPAGVSIGRFLIAAYGIGAYVIFLAVLLYTVAFVLDIDTRIGGVHVVGKSIDRGGIGTGGATVTAVGVDAAVLALFAVQHSVMARAGFKRRLTRVVPPNAERSTYVHAANVCLIALIATWHPVTADVLRVTGQPWRALLVGVALTGWAIALVSTLLIDHWDLFGLRQVFAELSRGPEQSDFSTPFLYRAVRHPLYLGFLLAFWATPDMTVGHLIFAATMTGYIMVGVRFEERDLIRTFGAQYRDYRRRVPMLVPGLRANLKRTIR